MLLADDVIPWVYKKLMKTLDWSVETLDRECNYKKTQKK
jgi:hypothetical protein